MIEFTRFWDVSAIIVGITAILVYFGKVIADTKVEKYEKTDIMIAGFIHCLIFILLPLAIILFLYQKNVILSIPYWVVFLFHIVILGIYSKHYFSYKEIRKFGQEPEYNKRFDAKIEDIKTTNPFIFKLINQKKRLIRQTLYWFDIIFHFFEDARVLMVLSILIFYSVLLAIQNGNVIYITTIIILSFLNLTLIAIARGLSTTYYPYAKLSLINGEKLDGKVLKFGDFIYIVKKGKKYFINKDHVKIIEMNILINKHETRK